MWKKQVDADYSPAMFKHLNVRVIKNMHVINRKIKCIYVLTHRSYANAFVQTSFYFAGANPPHEKSVQPAGHRSFFNIHHIVGAGFIQSDE